MKRKILTIVAALVVTTALPVACHRRPPLVAPAEVSLDDIIATHIESKGGMDAMDAIKSMRLEATMMMGPGMEAPIVMEMKRPNSMRIEFEFQGMTGIQAYDGETGWQIIPFAGSTEPQKVTGAELDDFVERADFDGPLVNYEQLGDKLEYLGTEDVEGTETHKVKLTKQNGDETVYFLDTERCLEIKSESTTTMQGMEIDVSVTYGDYKEVAGVMMPHTITQAAAGAPMSQTIKFDKIETNLDIADERFAFPEPEPTAEAPAAAEGE